MQAPKRFRLSTDVKARGATRGNLATLPEVRMTSSPVDSGVCVRAEDSRTKWSGRAPQEASMNSLFCVCGRPVRRVFSSDLLPLSDLRHQSYHGRWRGLGPPLSPVGSGLRSRIDPSGTAEHFLAVHRESATESRRRPIPHAVDQFTCTGHETQITKAPSARDLN